MSRELAAKAAAVALAGAVLFSRHAHAQERDPAAAEALFGQARVLMNTQRYSEACPKLAESQRLDPGIGTQFRLAVCYEYEGKLASAWAAFLEVASLATASGQHERARAASRRASLLESRLPRLKIAVPAASRAPGLEITRDATVVGEAQWDVALPVDPGDHQVEVTAPKRRAFAAVVNVTEGTTASFEVPPLEPAAVEAPTHTTPAPVVRVSPQKQPLAPPPGAQPLRAPVPEAQQSEQSSGPGALVIGLGIAGVVGVGAGTVLGLVARSKNESSKSHCSPQDENSCNAEGVNLRNKAFVFSDLATAGFIVGGAALASAAILWLLRGGSEPSRGEAVISVYAGPTAASVAVQGKF